MTLTSAGFEGEVNDVEWAILNQLGKDGVLGFNVSTAGPGTTRQVTVSSGQANVGGVLAVDTSSGLVTLDANPSSYARIDRIVLRAVWAGESSTMQLTFRKGTPSSNPQPPTLPDDPGDEYEVTLAQVLVASGAGEFTASDITRENTPPAAGAYYITSIAQAPREDGAVFFYGPGNAQYVVEGGVNKLLANTSSSDNALPDGPANWTGARRYIRRSGWVELSIDLLRQNSTSPVNVQLGVLPVGNRPSRLQYGVLVTPSNKEAIQCEVTTAGVVTAVGLNVGENQRLRGSFSFPLD